MTEAKSEITLKFSELPSAKELPDKKVELEFTDQNGLTFTAVVNGKSWRKASTQASEFESWSGAVSGKLGKSENGLQILEGGVQVFEKASKNKPPAEEPSVTST